jgi:hypothetical protein
MAVPVVFIASSSEGLNVVDAVQKLLQRALGGTAEVRPWPSTFQLTMAYIESLERLLDWSDFAVLVLTPDDRTKSREDERLSPRDNVVFEIGLFFGRLGRKRCFLIQQHDPDLKLPSDLLGIETAAFSISPGQDIESALESACARIGDAVHDAMNKLPSRPRLGEEERAVQTAIRRFGDRITGTWWERIQAKGVPPALSFFTIELDDVHNSVRLVGKAYNADGVHVANWRSAAARLERERIVYVRECQRLDAKTTAWLAGLAEVTFNDSSDVIDQGDGKFWESDESRPEDTVIKFVELRRNRDEIEALTMRKESEGDRQALVRKTLGIW